MPITPIDLQISISQVVEVGRTEHAKSESLVGQQHLMEKQSAEISKNKNTVLEKSKKTEKNEIRSEEHKERNLQHEHEHGGHDHKDEEPAAESRSYDEKLGKFIDILK